MAQLDATRQSAGEVRGTDAPTYSKRSALAAGAALLAPIGAGCSSVAGGLQVVSADARWTAFANVEITTVVENTSSSQQSGSLAAQVNLSNGSSAVDQMPVTVRGSARETFDMTIDTGLGDALTSDSIQYDVWME